MMFGNSDFNSVIIVEQLYYRTYSDFRAFNLFHWKKFVNFQDKFDFDSSDWTNL